MTANSVKEFKTKLGGCWSKVFSELLKRVMSTKGSFHSRAVLGMPILSSLFYALGVRSVARVQVSIWILLMCVVDAF